MRLKGEKWTRVYVREQVVVTEREREREIGRVDEENDKEVENSCVRRY